MTWGAFIWSQSKVDHAVSRCVQIFWSQFHRECTHRKEMYWKLSSRAVIKSYLAKNFMFSKVIVSVHMYTYIFLKHIFQTLRVLQFYPPLLFFYLTASRDWINNDIFEYLEFDRKLCFYEWRTNYEKFQR